MDSIGVVEEAMAGTFKLTGDDKAKGDGEIDDEEEEGDKEELRFDKEELCTLSGVGEEDETSRWLKENETVAGTLAGGWDGVGRVWGGGAMRRGPSPSFLEGKADDG